MRIEDQDSFMFRALKSELAKYDSTAVLVDFATPGDADPGASVNQAFYATSAGTMVGWKDKDNADIVIPTNYWQCYIKKNSDGYTVEPLKDGEGYFDNKQLNNIFSELFIDKTGVNESINIEDLRLRYITKTETAIAIYFDNSVDDNGDASYKTLMSYHLEYSSESEFPEIITLSEGNSSGLIGYAIVDWSYVTDGFMSSMQLKPKSRVYDVKFSPSIKSSFEKTLTDASIAATNETIESTTNDQLETKKRIGISNRILNGLFDDVLDNWTELIPSLSPTIVDYDGRTSVFHFTGVLADRCVRYQDIDVSFVKNKNVKISFDYAGVNIVEGSTNYLLGLYFEIRKNGTSIGSFRIELSDSDFSTSFQTKTLPINSFLSNYDFEQLRVHIYARDFTGDVYFDNIKLLSSDVVDDDYYSNKIRLAEASSENVILKNHIDILDKFISDNLSKMADDSSKFEDVVLDIDFTDGSVTDVTDYFASESLSEPKDHTQDRILANAVLEDNLLKLKNTLYDEPSLMFYACSLRLLNTLRYGMIESEMAISNAKAVNNSIWLRGTIGSGAISKQFEIDVNEGKYPNVVDTNVHDWSTGESIQDPKGFQLTTKLKKQTTSHFFEKRIFTKKIRIEFDFYKRLHIPLIVALGDEIKDVDIFDQDFVDSIAGKNLIDENSTLAYSSALDIVSYPIEAIYNPIILGNANHFIFGDNDDGKYIEIEFADYVEISSIHVLHGWGGYTNNDSWTERSNKVVIKYIDPIVGVYVTAKNDDFKRNDITSFHKYKCIWDENFIKFFVDDKLLRVEKNKFCNEPADLLLSTYVGIGNADVTTAVDGTYMAFKNLSVKSYLEADSNTDEFFSSLSTKLSEYDRKQITILVNSIKRATGVSSLSEACDKIRIPCATEEASLRNIVKDAHHSIAVNSPVFTAYEGFSGDGISAYIDENYNPTTDAVNVSQDDCSFGVYVRTDIAADQYEIGSRIGYNNKQTFINPKSSAGSLLYSAADSLASGITGLSSNNGMMIVSREDSETKNLFHNGVKYSSEVPSTGFFNGNIYAMSLNNNGTASFFSTRQHSMVIIGRSLTHREAKLISIAFERYMNTYGKGVVS